MSVDFLTAKKVATKRVEIPHTTLKTATMERDMYIPSAKLILVDRSYYAREWVKSNTKGTSTRDESIAFETADSINGHTGFMSEALVSEEDAALFLYTFGLKPDTEKYESENHKKFASVAYGYSLADVMDNNVRRQAQAIAAREFGSKSTNDCIKLKKEIITTVDKETKEAYKGTGITIRYIGFAEGLTWDNPKIQASIDSVFIAKTEATAVDSRKQLLAVSSIEAEVKIKEGVAEAVKKWNGQLPALPNWLVLTGNLWDTVTSFFRSGPETAVPVKKLDK